MDDEKNAHALPVLPATGNSVVDEKLVAACNHFMRGAEALLMIAPGRARSLALTHLDDCLLWTCQAAIREAQSSRIVVPTRAPAANAPE